MYENVYLDSLFVRQLKHRDFIYNALNFLNDKNKRFLNCLTFLSLYLIFFSCSLALCLIVLMKKTKGLQIIYLYFSFNLLFLLSSYIYIYIYMRNARGSPNVFSWGSPNPLWKLIQEKNIILMGPQLILFQICFHKGLGEP